LIAGLKLAGTVNAVGSDVTGINVGDRVAAVLSAISDGTLKVPIEGEYAFEDVNDMFAALASRQVSGKVVLKISAD
jgi:NADPH:quinone reductase-like Zn-dependent oxidoreductase